MLKKTITYNDYNGNERTEDFYFNLTKAELMEMEMSKQGGLVATINKIVSQQDGPEIMKIFKELILKAYGEKSMDGKRFMKVDTNGNPLSLAFSQTEAYSQLFMEIATNDKAAADFINGIVPADVNTNGQKDMKQLVSGKLPE